MKPLVDPLFHPIFLGRRGLDSNPYEDAGAVEREPIEAPLQERRNRDVHIDHTVLALRIDEESGTIEGEAVLSVIAFAKPVREMRLDAIGLEVKRVSGTMDRALDTGRGRSARKRRNGGRPRKSPERAFSWDLGPDSLRVEFPRELPAFGAATVRIAYRAKPRTGLHFIRPDPAYPNRPTQVWSQGEAEDSRHWFPCHDAPNDKGSVDLELTVRERFLTVANGRLVRVLRGPGKGWRTWHWSQEEPIPAYLISLIVGEYSLRRSSHRGTPLHDYYYRDKREEALVLFRKTRDMMRVFEERFGQPFPYAKYAQTVVANFTFGGMENASATTLTDDALADSSASADYDFESLISHELAHSWWGDLVTAKDWPNAWLNESFATYGSVLYEEAAYGRDRKQFRLVHDYNHYLAQDRCEYRRPILSYRYAEPIDLFDRHHYQKGSLVLEMLRFVLGDAGFFASLTNYLGRHAHGNAETADLLRAIEETTGENLAWFFQDWIHGAGYPELEVEHSWDARTRNLTVEVAQKQKTDEGTPLFRIPVEIAVRTARGSDTFRVRLTLPKQTFVFPLSSRPLYVAFDPARRILSTISHRQSRGELLARLERDPEGVGRASAARLLAGYPDAEVVRALGRALRGDRSEGVRMVAAIALGEASVDGALAVLLKSVGQKSPNVRRSVVFGIGSYREPRAHRAIARAIEEDESYMVRATALFALVNARHPDVFSLLSSALSIDSHAEVVRATAFDAMAFLKDTAAIPLAMTWSEHGRPKGARVGAIRCLGALGKGDATVYDRLLFLLKDPLHDIRNAATTALGALGEKRSLSILEARLSDEPIDRVRQSTRKAIRKLAKA